MLVRRALTAGLGRSPDDELVRRVLSAFLDAYRDHLFVRSRLYPGVPDVLASLNAAGILIGCVTNKPQAFAIDLLEQAGIVDAFDFVYGGDTFARKKPDPEPLQRAAERCGITPDLGVMIGDSVNDSEAARQAGFAFIFAAYGYVQTEDPRLKQGLATIGSFIELSELLCQ
jgi:phosphoglycolate phosphatase